MATCLPVLFGSVNTIPDDSAVSDLPNGQVDYLSHEWREEDVWRSWRNMTRLKNEIANGVRLENASWRTWWKQRNGLGTVTPETLNWSVRPFLIVEIVASAHLYFASLASSLTAESWFDIAMVPPSHAHICTYRLKDSDVTWLYGPLHTAVPTPRPSPRATAALDLSSSPSPMLSGIVRKPILKRRSICELLASEFPLSPVFSPPDSDSDDAPHVMSDGADPASLHKPIRPSLLHTKSDSHITRWGPNPAFRRDSPPRMAPNVPAELPASSLLQAESPPFSMAPGPKRKHISFNTFVEQCIAIDKPKKKRLHYSTSNPHLPILDDDGLVTTPASCSVHSCLSPRYDEDSEDGIIDEADEILFDDDDDHRDTHHPEPSYPHPHHSPPPHHVSPPSSSTSEEEEEDDILEMRVRHPASLPAPRSPTHSPSSTSSSSPHSRPPNARSTSYGRRAHASNGFIMRSPSTDKELVTIALIAPTILKTRLDDDDDEHPYYSFSHSHLPSHPRRLRDRHLTNGVHGSSVELVYVPPSYIYSATEESEDVIEENRNTETYDASLATQPQPQTTMVPTPRVPVFQQDRNADAADSTQLLAPAVTTYIPQGASVITIDRTPAGPQVIVSSSDGQPDVPRSRSHSRSRSRSRSRTPSPNEMTTATNIVPSSSAIVVPRGNQAIGNIFLAPSDPAPSRGRSASSSSLPSQVEQSRGRSITRTSSFSDRESLNAASPDANVGLTIGTVGLRDRERDSRGEREAKRTAERGRDRCTRRSGSHSGSGSNSSLSPENPHATVCVPVVERPRPEQAPLPGVRKKPTSGSFSSGSSAATVIPTSTARSPPRLVLDAKPITQTSYTEASPAPIPISPSHTQEEQESISRHPTPANSPVLPMRFPPSPIARHERNRSGDSRSPTRNGDDGQQGTLVGRAVEIMSNAGAFLGSLWHSGTPAGVPTS
ncbi:hypothetical protein JVT61DRAFT_315 [Boletus reticuloceps]|uniref:Nitrogen regulatory protein areA GATA-like domain-containing protein n=1 Tax=Boletus reticuloceps TaxID=495285 RepID=A0A8I2Z3C8_9AGAM|nr:hypothetical protein JVT61DRAFT_315 [Boletus reticuloceps]